MSVEYSFCGGSVPRVMLGSHQTSGHIHHNLNLQIDSILSEEKTTFTLKIIYILSEGN